MFSTKGFWHQYVAQYHLSALGSSEKCLSKVNLKYAYVSVFTLVSHKIYLDSKEIYNEAERKNVEKHLFKKKRKKN